MNKRLCSHAVVLSLFLAFANDLSAQTRIRFSRGRTSTTVSGSLGGAYGKTYILGARRGQVFSGNISSRGDCIVFSAGATSMTYVTEPGDNLVRIRNNCRSAANFTMTVSINFGSD